MSFPAILYVVVGRLGRAAVTEGGVHASVPSAFQLATVQPTTTDVTTSLVKNSNVQKNLNDKDKN